MNGTENSCTRTLFGENALPRTAGPVHFDGSLVNGEDQLLELPDAETQGEGYE